MSWPDREYFIFDPVSLRPVCFDAAPGPAFPIPAFPNPAFPSPAPPDVATSDASVGETCEPPTRVNKARQISIEAKAATRNNTSIARGLIDHPFLQPAHHPPP
jgi:hypothetical protein